MLLGDGFSGVSSLVLEGLCYFRKVMIKTNSTMGLPNEQDEEKEEK